MAMRARIVYMGFSDFSLAIRRTGIIQGPETLTFPLCPNIRWDLNCKYYALLC